MSSSSTGTACPTFLKSICMQDLFTMLFPWLWLVLLETKEKAWSGFTPYPFSPLEGRQRASRRAAKYISSWNILCIFPGSMAFPFPHTVFSWYWTSSINLIPLRTVKNRTLMWVAGFIYLPLKRGKFSKYRKYIRRTNYYTEKFGERIVTYFPLLLLLQFRPLGTMAEVYLAKHGKNRAQMCSSFSVGRKHAISV